MARLARLAYKAGPRPAVSDHVPAPWQSDLAEFLRMGSAQSLYSTSECAEVIAAISGDPAFEPLTRGAVGLFVTHPTGGSRLDLRVDLVGMLDVSWIQLALDGGEPTEERYVARALNNLAQLEDLLTSRQVRAHRVTALSGLRLLPGTELSLPWGTVITTPPTPGEPSHRSEPLLVEHLVLPVALSHEAEPEMPSFPCENHGRLDLLVPLAFVLGTVSSGPHAPLMTYRSVVVPYTGSSGGGGPIALFEKGPHTLTEEEACAVTEVATLVEANHQPQLDVAARRLVQSVQVRLDPQDVLIDAVTAWEALVGTTNETSFRVCAALTFLLQPDATQRAAFHKQLRSIYNLRSRVVHGANVRSDEVLEASRIAVDIAARAMTEVYRRGADWTAMESQDRADQLILGRS